MILNPVNHAFAEFTGNVCKRPLGLLSEPLAEIPAGHIRQLPPESAWLISRCFSATLVPDARAAGGYAAKGDVTGQPFLVGYYDEIGRIQYGIHIPPDEAGSDYRLYRLSEPSVARSATEPFSGKYGLFNFDGIPKLEPAEGVYRMTVDVKGSRMRGTQHAAS